MDRRIAVYRRLRLLPVLLQGPPGCGKSHLARTELHAGPGRFVRVNCAALVGDLAAAEIFGNTAHAFTGAADRAGRLEEARDGTLFLDEAHALDARRQQMLNTWLDDGKYHRLGDDRERRVSARLVLASYRPAAEWMMPDLRSRIGPHVLDVPPPGRAELRARLEARCRELDARARIAEATFDALLARPTPRDALTGLEAALVAALAAGRLELLPADVPGAPQAPREAADRAAADILLAAAGGNVTRAARLAGVSRSTFYRRYPPGGPVRGRGDPADEASPGTGR